MLSAQLSQQTFIIISSASRQLEHCRSESQATKRLRAGWAAEVRVALALAGLTGALQVFSAPATSGARRSDGLALAESERVFIASIEHHGLILTRKGFPAIAAAILENDSAKLSGFLSASFRGEILDLERSPALETDAVKIHWASTSNEKMKAVPASAEAFARHLLDLRNRFGQSPKVEMALMSLSPLQRDNIAGAWKGTSVLRMAGPTKEGATAEVVCKLAFDMARIPDVDLIASETNWVDSFRVFEAQQSVTKRPLMVEVAKERGIDSALFADNWTLAASNRSVVTGGLYVTDVDDDGHDDILVTDLNGVFLFRGLADGGFTEVTGKSGLPRKGTYLNAVFGDFDNDGLVDLILDHRVFRNMGGCRFEEVTGRTNLRIGGMYVIGYSVTDYNKDGLLDLYVAKSHGPGGRHGNDSWIDGPGGPGNQLWRNLGNWQFEEVSLKANARAGRRSCFTANWLDANNDNWPDIYVINEFGGGVLLINQQNGTFKEQPLLPDDPGDFGSMGLAVGDFNNDGNIDIYAANMYSKAGRRIMENLPDGTYPPDVFAKIKRFVTGSELYRNLGGLKFERVGQAMRVRAVGWAYGPSFVDLDNDGFLDIYANAGFMSYTRVDPDG